MKFTDMLIKNLKTDKKMYLRDSDGFTIRVMPSGSKTWLFVYTFEGKRKEMNLGNYPGVSLAEAKKKHGDAWKLWSNDKDPGAIAAEAKDERRAAPTVSKLVEDYVEKHAKVKKRSWQEDERVLNKEVIPFWNKIKAADVKKRDVVLLLEGIVERGSPGMANNAFQVIRKMFNWAVEKDILEITPCTGIKAPAPKNTRERALSEDEIKLFWLNLDKCAISAEIKDALQLILVTAQRPGEVVGLHTSEIDNEWWNIPSERSKNGKPHRVYLTAAARGIIGKAIARVKTNREIPLETEYDGYVFPCPHLTKIKSIDRHAMAIATMRNLAWPLTNQAGKPLFDKDGKPATENRFGIDHFTPHDLRRTAATFMAQAGEMDEVIDAVLNHAKQGVIKVYNLYRYDKEKQAALLTWERKLLAITGKKESNVIPMKRKAGVKK